MTPHECQFVVWLQNCVLWMREYGNFSWNSVNYAICIQAEGAGKWYFDDWMGVAWARCAWEMRLDCCSWCSCKLVGRSDFRAGERRIIRRRGCRVQISPIACKRGQVRSLLSEGPWSPVQSLHLPDLEKSYISSWYLWWWWKRNFDNPVIIKFLTLEKELQCRSHVQTAWNLYRESDLKKPVKEIWKIKILFFIFWNTSSHFNHDSCWLRQGFLPKGHQKREHNTGWMPFTVLPAGTS
jgi:hypothetical protein